MQTPSTHRAEKTGRVSQNVKSMLTATERMQMILAAPPQTLARIDAILQGEDTTSGKAEPDLRTITVADASRRLGVCRSTVYALVKVGRLQTVPFFGTNRIVLQSIIDFFSDSRQADADESGAVRPVVRQRVQRRAAKRKEVTK